MPFADIDDAFRDSIKDDIQIFDNKESLQIEHNSDDADVDFSTGITSRAIVHTVVPNCLFRQPSQRNGPAIPQLHERAQSIQKDDFNKFDAVIEVPMIEGLNIKEKDLIVRIKDNTKWRVVMLDDSTLSTRFRLGCSRAV